MLIQFLAENFLSFKDETVFSMLAPPEETRAVVEIPSHGLRLMRIAAFYGANASGKSNIIKALETARDVITRERSTDTKLPARVFRLDPASASKPSRFQFDFIVDDIRYSYVLAFTRESITAEALYRQLSNGLQEEMVYEREAPSDGGEHRVSFGPMIDSRNDEDRQFARFTARGAHVRQPLLNKFATSNVGEFVNIFAWFQSGLAVIDASAKYSNLVQELYLDASLRDFFGHMLGKMGTGVQSVAVEKKEHSRLSQMWLEFKDITQQPHAADFLNSMVSGMTRSDAGIAIHTDGNEPCFLELRLTHRNRTGVETYFPLWDESDGTQRLLHLLPVLFHRTKESGLCTVIDELDRSLHTSLTRHFVSEFLEMTADTHTQLIFTTHDTNLLNGRLLPPRAIWFVEKDDDGASRIHSLSEYKPEQLDHLLEHLEEGYLQGRFGAIPFLASRESIAWKSEPETPQA